MSYLLLRVVTYSTNHTIPYHTIIPYYHTIPYHHHTTNVYQCPMEFSAPVVPNVCVCVVHTAQTNLNANGRSTT